MNEIKSIGFALDPTNIPSFLLDWEITKRCNLDCSYCGPGLDGGHDNTMEHPLLEDCLKTIDFMFEYVDLYNQHKKASQTNVILNVYGGESLFHPDIVTILHACRSKYEKYSKSWNLIINCTTNGIVGTRQWKKIVSLIDEFTLSYHPENLPKQKKQYLDNIFYLKEQNKKFKCVVMMHTDEDLFNDSLKFIDLCKDKSIRYVPKPLDNIEKEWIYTKDQFDTLKTFWINQVKTSQKLEYTKKIDLIGNTDKVHSLSEGRPCCGGRKLSLNGDLKSSVSFVPRQGFLDWYCSVNWFFLHIRQADGAVFTNTDCRISTVTNKVEPLGYISNTKQILDTLKHQFETKTMPIIQCVNQSCICGICAPKAENFNEFTQLIKRNVVKDVFLTTNNIT
jgi:pyruvate-formate lyase-activating enzyme